MADSPETQNGTGQRGHVLTAGARPGRFGNDLPRCVGVLGTESMLVLPAPGVVEDAEVRVPLRAWLAPGRTRCAA